MRRTKVFIGGAGGEEDKPRKIDALMISHRYDDECLYVTVPEIYLTPELEDDYVFLLDEIAKVLSMNLIKVNFNY